MSRFRPFLCAAAAVMAFGCGDRGESSPGAPTNAATLAALETTNLSFQVPHNQFVQTAGMLKRWDLPIPVKLNGEPRAIAAIDEIERQLGFTVFDRTSIANTPDDRIARGLIVSVGTSVARPGRNPAHNCGSVGTPSTGAPPAPTRQMWPSNTALNQRQYINLDGPACVASLDVAIHQFEHALGMWNHFEGFGNGRPSSALSWRVLRTIYANPSLAPLNAIVLP